MRVNRSLLLVILVIILVSTVSAVEVDNEVEKAFSEGKETVDVIVVLEDQPLEQQGILGIVSENYDDRNEMVQSVQEEVLENLEVKDVSGGEEIQQDLVNQDQNNEDYDLELKRQFSIVNGFSGKVTEEGLEKLKNDLLVKKIIPNKIFQTTLTTSIPQINANDVWNFSVSGYNITGKGETICVIDSGIDTDHDAFKDKIKDQYCYCSLKNADGNNCCPDDTSEDSSAEDDNGHGTHVTGIAAGNLSTYTGVAKDAGIIALKVCNSSGSCGTADVISAIEWCTNNATKYNISVISMSLGDTSQNNDYCNDDSTASVINTAVGKNISVVIAAGNEGYTAGIAAPACVQNATPVGAVNSADSISYNRGDILDLVAPGISITAPHNDGGTVARSGTSMAQPHVAGAIALFRQYWRLAYSLTPKPEEIENKLRITGKIIDDTGSSGNYYYRINVLSALQPFINYTLTSVVNATVTKINNSLINISSDVNLSNAMLEWIYANGSVINYSMNKYNGTSFYFNITHLVEGTDTYYVYGNDTVGTLGTSKVRTLIIDNTAPLVNITYPTNDTNLSSGLQAFNVSIKDINTVTSVLFSFDNFSGNGFNLTSTNVSGLWNANLNLSRLTEGPQIMTVIANDTVNNFNRSVIVQFTVDRTPPKVNFQTPLTERNYSLTSSNQTFNVSVSDTNTSIDTVLFSFDNSTDTGFNITAVNQSGYWSASYNVSTLTEGRHIVTAIANDSVGNYNRTEIISFTVDYSAPTISFNTLTGRNYSKTSFDQTFSVGIKDLTVDSVLFSFDNASGTAFNVTATNSSGTWTASYNVSSLAEGNHILTVIANDTHNHLNNTQTLSFTTDYISLPVNSVSSGSLSSSGAKITWSTLELANSTVDYGKTKSLGSSRSSTVRVTSHSITLSGLSSSTTYYYNVTSCDYADNCNSSGNYSFTTSSVGTSGAGGGSSGGGSGGSSGSSSSGGGAVSTTSADALETQETESEVLDISEAVEEPVVEDDFEEEPTEEMKLFSQETTITKKEKSIIKIEKKNIPVTEIVIDSDVDKEVVVEVSLIEEKPELVTELSNVYKYMEIKVGLEEEELDSAQVTFKVEKSWLFENNYHEETVNLQSFNEVEGKWEELETKLLEHEDKEIVYQADVEHFSYFAITAKIEKEKIFFEKDSIFSGKSGIFLIVMLSLIIILSILYLLLRDH